jgi:type II secretory pathway pseudopilin PulG
MVLVELMMAVIILLIVSLALMQTSILSIDANARTMIRDEAVRLAESKMDEMKNRSYPGSTTVVNSTDPVTRSLRSMSKTYDVYAIINADDSTMTVTVDWDWKGEDFTHSISTIRTAAD